MGKWEWKELKWCMDKIRTLGALNKKIDLVSWRYSSLKFFRQEWMGGNEWTHTPPTPPGRQTLKKSRLKSLSFLKNNFVDCVDRVDRVLNH